MASQTISLREFRSVVFDDIPFYFEETTIGGERAFTSDIGSGYTVAIITSIPTDKTYSRGKGEDAIRVIVRDENNELVDSASHTKRTEGFGERVKEKVLAFMTCPYTDCDGAIKVADGPHGAYYFCTDDDCTHTESI